MSRGRGNPNGPRRPGKLPPKPGPVAGHVGPPAPGDAAPSTIQMPTMLDGQPVTAGLMICQLADGRIIVPHAPANPALVDALLGGARRNLDHYFLKQMYEFERIARKDAKPMILTASGDPASLDKAMRKPD